MHKQQRGVSLIGVLIIGAFAGFFLLMAMRSVPVFVENNAIKRVFKQMKDNLPPDMSVAMIRRDFSLKSSIDDISSINQDDIEVTKEGGQIVLSVDYERRVPIFGNAYLLYVFSVNSQNL